MIKNIITLIVSLIVLSAAFYVNQYAWVLQTFLTLSVYGMVLYSIHYFWRGFRKKSIMWFNEFMINFALSASCFIIIITAALWYFGYYHNIKNPLTIQQHTITNGEKTVVFQEMIHIASQNYYDNIAQEITQYKQDWFVHFYEWVKAGSQENSNAFNTALWVKFDENLYKNMSKLYWLVPQNNADFLGLVNDKDFNVDTNIDYIMWEYEKIKSENKIEKKYSAPVDVSAQAIETLAQLEWRELEILVFMNQAILSAFTKNDQLVDIVHTNFWNQELYNIILDGRNSIIADKIIESEYKKIFASYGALHFKWILKLLQENDPNWKVVETKDYYPFQ